MVMQGSAMIADSRQQQRDSWQMADADDRWRMADDG